MSYPRSGWQTSVAQRGVVTFSFTTVNGPFSLKGQIITEAKSTHQIFRPLPINNVGIDKR